jgi:hypothetical protein
MFESFGEPVGIDIAKCQGRRCGSFSVGTDVCTASADATASDDAMSDGVTGSHPPRPAENMSRYDVE